MTRRRGVWYVKPALRGWLHLLWFEASLVLGTLLVARAHGAVRITALAIYAASVSAMFGISALYHRGNWSAGVEPAAAAAGSRDDLRRRGVPVRRDRAVSHQPGLTPSGHDNGRPGRSRPVS